MGRSKTDAIKENGAKKKAANNKGARAQAQKIAERAKAQDTRKRKLSDSQDDLEKGGSGSESEVAETTESSSDDGVVEEEIVEKTKKLKKAEDTIKHLDASIAAQEATNQKRLAELAQTRNNYQSEVEVTELYFRNVVSEIQFHYSLRTMH
jgi:hypothetical protein